MQEKLQGLNCNLSWSGTPEFDGLKAGIRIEIGLEYSAGIGVATAAGNLVSGKSTEDTVYNQKKILDKLRLTMTEL